MWLRSRTFVFTWAASALELRVAGRDAALEQGQAGQRSVAHVVFLVFPRVRLEIADAAVDRRVDLGLVDTPNIGAQELRRIRRDGERVDVGVGLVVDTLLADQRFWLAVIVLGGQPPCCPGLEGLADSSRLANVGWCHGRGDGERLAVGTRLRRQTMIGHASNDPGEE